MLTTNVIAAVLHVKRGKHPKQQFIIDNAPQVFTRECVNKMALKIESNRMTSPIVIGPANELAETKLEYPVSWPFCNHNHG